MKKILIICFYELKEYFISIKENFEKYLYEIISYPLFRFAYDKYDKKDNYTEDLNNFIKENLPDVILWWFIDVEVDTFTKIKKSNPNIYYIMYNTDEDVNMNYNLLKKAEIFDLVITTTNENFLKYRVHSQVKNLLYLPFGFDEKIYYPLNEETYNCDISFFCYNLCIDTNFYNKQHINKMEFIKNVIEYAKNKNRKFNIYGPSFLKEYYPKNYVEDPTYINKNNIINESKINIILHSFSDKSQYLDTNVTTILGAGGFLFIDKIKNIDKVFKNGNNCIILDNDKYINQIEYILKNYEKYKNIKENGYELSKKFRWSEWVKAIHIEICKRYYDEESYKDLYNLEGNDLWNYWLEKGINENQICYKINIPSSFKIDEYKKSINLIDKSDNYVYLHWYKNSRNEVFTQTKNNLNINFEEYGITPEDSFRVCEALNKISNYLTMEEGIDELKKIGEEKPNININKMLEYYFGICE